MPFDAPTTEPAHLQRRRAEPSGSHKGEDHIEGHIEACNDDAQSLVGAM